MATPLVTARWTSSAAAKFAILVHGGAGDVPVARRPQHQAGCLLAARAGAEILARGGSAEDAVQRAVELLEDDPSYNAGTGGSLDESGELALDASFMSGASLRAGAVCVLPPFSHPIAIARAVHDDGRHVLLAGPGAAEFAIEKGFSPVDPRSMITDGARARLAAVKKGTAEAGWAGGTVGAVARDADGHVAVATSTGGTVGKRRGRVGDTPIVGAGSYADDRTGAASCTGDGEGFLRIGVALRACDGLGGGEAIDAVAARVLTLTYERTAATGGVILVDRDGRLGLARTTATMSWGAVWDENELSSC